MTDTPIERVARAMAANDSGPEGSVLFDLHWANFSHGYLKNARAAIAALEEPSDDILGAIHGCLPGTPDKYARPAAVEKWRAAIRAAITEGE